MNSFGRKLIQLCYTTGLTIANGRLGDDSDGKFTFCTSRGRSVNDYLLVSPIDYKLISYFNVLQFNEFSDHSPLFFQLNFSNNRPQNKNHKLHKYIKWDSNKNSDYMEVLQTERSALFSLVDNISSKNDLNTAVGGNHSCII